MEEQNKSVANTTEVQQNAEGNAQAQAQEAAAAVVPEKNYKELEAFATKTRQELIKTAVQLTKQDPKYLTSISDPKLQASVAKEIYGLESLAQVKEVFGEKFYEKNESEDAGKVEVEDLRKEIKLMKVKGEADKIDAAVATMGLSEDKAEAFKAELRLINADLPLEVRIQKAKRLAFGETPDDGAKALLQINKATGAAPSSAAAQTKQEDPAKTIAKANVAWLFQNR